MKVYLDDIRDTPDGWTRTHTVDETIDLLKKGGVEELSLDNDLGEGEREGYEVAVWLEEQVATKGMAPPAVIHVHSVNVSRKLMMEKVVGRIHEFARRNANKDENA